MFVCLVGCLVVPATAATSVGPPVKINKNIIFGLSKHRNLKWSLETRSDTRCELITAVPFLLKNIFNARYKQLELMLPSAVH